MKQIYLLLGIVLLALVGCRESLEDTISDYTGDGPVRYVGMCSNVTVESGWKRLTVKWKNSLDPNVVENKVTCSAGSYVFDTVVPAAVEECVIRGLEDASYEITVRAIDDKGNASLTTNEVKYGRPYTDNHEEVIGFTRGIMKHFFVKNNLVLFYGTWNANIERFWLEYTGTDNVKREHELNAAEFAKKFVLVEDVQVGKPVVLKRRGRLANCPDEIAFADYTLPHEPTLLSDFKLAMRERYGETDFKADFLNRTELELDYDLVSLEDILAFPNLTKLVLGKNRYMTSDQMTNSSELSDSKRALSLFCLDVAGKFLQGLEVERYNTHYFPEGTAGITDMKDANLVDLDALTTLDMTGWTVNCSPEVPGFDGNSLLDDNAKTIWKPLQHSGTARTFELTVDMKSIRSINGLKVMQADVAGVDINFLPIGVKIRVSGNGIDWQNPTYVEENTLGGAPGEATLIRFNRQYDIRYIRVMVSDRRYQTSNQASLGTLLGDIVPFQE